MSSAQKVTLENVNMMIDAGFNPLNQICDATGESMSDLYKRISDGKVSFSELEAAVEAATSQGGQFYNGMLEASQTFSGRMSTLQDNVSALTGELTSGLFAALGELVVKLNEVVVSFLDSDEKMAQLKETIGVLTAAVVAVAAAIMSYKATVAATTAITALCTAATTAKAAADKAAEAGAKGLAVAQAALNAVMKANTVGIVVSAVAALAAGLITAYQTSETFRKFVSGAFQFVANIAQSTIGAAIGWLDKLSYKLNSFLGKDGYTGFDSYDDYKASKTPAKSNTVTDDDRARRQKLHAERVKQAQEEAAAAKASAETVAQSAETAASAVSTSGKKAGASAQMAAATVVKSISDTTTTVKDGVTRTVETVNETLSNGATQQKQTITETSRQMVNGVLKDVKTITEVAADGTKTVKQTMETVREVAKTVTATTSGLVDGIQTSVQTVTETLTDGTTQQKQVLTEVYDDIVDGALVTIERVKTVAADGTVQVAEKIKKSSADTFDGLWKELQTEADTGVLGTFSDLYTAVKNQDWLSIGKWVASTIYSGLTADQKKQVQSFALGIVTKLNEALGGARDKLVQGAIDLGTQIVNGLTGGFSEVWQQAHLGSTLVSVFQGLQEPLSAAALAISQGLSGGFLSCMPEILAGAGSVIVAIGSAFTGMLEAIGATLTAFGIPTGPAMIIAGVALVAAIAGIVAALGVSFSKKGSSGRGSSGGSSGSGSMGSVDITTGTGSLEDAINANTKALEKTNSALADMIRQAGALVLSDNMRLGSTVAASGTAQVVSAARSYHREGDTNITQNFYNGHDTAAAQQREARWEADKARRQRR